MGSINDGKSIHKCFEMSSPRLLRVRHLSRCLLVDAQRRETAVNGRERDSEEPAGAHDGPKPRSFLTVGHRLVISCLLIGVISAWGITRRLHETSRGVRLRPGFEPSSRRLELRSTSRRADSWTCLSPCSPLPTLPAADSAVLASCRDRRC